MATVLILGHHSQYLASIVWKGGSKTPWELTAESRESWELSCARRSVSGEICHLEPLCPHPYQGRLSRPESWALYGSPLSLLGSSWQDSTNNAILFAEE